MTRRLARHPDGAVHFSQLRAIERSPAHYREACRALAAGEHEATAAMRRGSLVHELVLGPRARGPLPTCDTSSRSTKVWKEFAEQMGRAGWPEGDLVLASEREEAEPIARALLAAPAFARYLATGFQRELPARWLDGAIECATDGIDVVGLDGDSLVALDVKTTSNASPRAFGRDAVDRLYHAQLAGFYGPAAASLFGRFPSRYLLVAVESAPPHCVVVYELPAALVTLGRKIVVGWLERLAICEERDEWPGYDTVGEPIPLEVPSWVDTLDGQFDDDGNPLPAPPPPAIPKALSIPARPVAYMPPEQGQPPPAVTRVERPRERQAPVQEDPHLGSTFRAPTSPASTEDPIGALADLGEHARSTAAAVARSGLTAGLGLLGRLRAGLGAALAPPVTHVTNVTNVATPPPASPPSGPPPAPRAPRKPRSSAATQNRETQGPTAEPPIPAVQSQCEPASDVVEKPDTIPERDGPAPNSPEDIGFAKSGPDPAFEASKLAAEQSRARAEAARRPPPLPAPSPAVAAAVERARARAAPGTPAEPPQRVLLETRAPGPCTVGLGCVLPDGHAGIHRGSLPHPTLPAGTLPDGRPNLFGDEPFTTRKP